MDFEGALRARITSANTSAASRVTWDERPQATPLPAVTLHDIVDQRPQHLKGFDGLKPRQVQIDCWAATSVARAVLREAVLAAVVPENTSNGIRFDRAIVDAIRGGGERVETQFVFRASLDLTFWWATA